MRRSRPARWIRGAPLPLKLLLLAAAACHLAWVFAVPALQQPDEASHVSYVQHVAEGEGIPWPGSGGPRTDLGLFSPEQRAASVVGGLEPLRGNPAARPLWTEADVRAYERAVAALGPGARSDIRDSSAFANPPLVYLYDAAVYRVSGGSFFDRVFVMRLANLPFLLLLVAATWWLASLVFGRRVAPVALTTAVVAVQPLLTSVAAGVAPDAALAALVTLGIGVAVLVARDGPTRGTVAALVALCALAGFTHGRGLGLVAPAAVALLFALRALPLSPGVRRAAFAGAGVAGLLVGIAALRYAQGSELSASGTRAFLSYLWQFYLPALPGMADPPFVGWTVRDVFVDRLYGTYGQLEILTPTWTVDALARGFLVLVLAGLVAAGVHRERLRAQLPVVAVLAAAVVGVLGLVHAQAFRGLLEDPGDPVMTGRYLLPILPVLAIALCATLMALPRRGFAVAGGLVASLAVLLQFTALGTMVVRFYA